MLSGRYQDLVGVPGVIRTHADNSWGHLHPDAVLLPELFRKAAYHTAIVGKWHLGLTSPNTPTERGFDHFGGAQVAFAERRRQRGRVPPEPFGAVGGGGLGCVGGGFHAGGAASAVAGAFALGERFPDGRRLRGHGVGGG